MSKSTYQVTVIYPDRRSDFYDFWEKGLKENTKGEVLHSALVAQTVDIEAGSKKEAEALALKKYPGHSIDAESTKRLG